MHTSDLPGIPAPLAAAGAVSRRAFLAGAAAAAVSRRAFLADVTAGETPAAGERFEPEYARRLSEVLVVYDQVAPGHLFLQVVEILGCLPSAHTVHFLCSRSRESEARARLAEHGLQANVLACSDDQLWGDWGRDIFHVSWREGRTVLVVPYTKTAATRGGLTRGYEILRGLLGPDRDVRLVPLCFEGGNIAYDRIAGERVMFVGNSVVCESRELYRRWFGRPLETAECLDLLRRSFNVDRVVLLGRLCDGAPVPQAALLFHMDMACAILAEGVAAVQTFDMPGSLGDLRDEVRSEIEQGAGAAPSANERDIEAAVETAFHAEVERLREARAELAAIERTFRDLGYRICPLATDWRRVRRTQSYANVLIARDRLIMPIFPRPDAGAARTVALPSGRQAVEVLQHPAPEQYAMDGWNLANYRTYRSFFGSVRVVRDAFYLAGGSVHCVVGAID